MHVEYELVLKFRTNTSTWIEVILLVNCTCSMLTRYFREAFPSIEVEVGRLLRPNYEPSFVVASYTFRQLLQQQYLASNQDLLAPLRNCEHWMAVVVAYLRWKNHHCNTTILSKSWTKNFNKNGNSKNNQIQTRIFIYWVIGKFVSAKFSIEIVMACANISDRSNELDNKLQISALKQMVPIRSKFEMKHYGYKYLATSHFA